MRRAEGVLAWNGGWLCLKIQDTKYRQPRCDGRWQKYLKREGWVPC